MTLVAVLIGILVGSFLTCLKNRLDNLGSILFGRSQCPKCKHKLGFLDLFPILSYLVLRGKCRYCKGKIPLEYILIELVTTAVALLVYMYFGFSLGSLALFLSLCLLIVASAVDIESREVHLYLLVTGIALAAISWIVLNFSSAGLFNLILGMVSAALIPFVFYLVSREKWMGLGDSLFALWIGALCGYPAALAGIMIAFFSGAMFGIMVLVLKKTDRAHRAIPFGPFIAFGGIVALLYGDRIIDFYLKLLGI